MVKKGRSHTRRWMTGFVATEECRRDNADIQMSHIFVGVRKVSTCMSAGMRDGSLADCIR